MENYPPTESKDSTESKEFEELEQSEYLGPPFSALVGTSHGVPVVEVRGEVDLATTPRLVEAIGVAGSRLDGRPLLVVDLRGIEFIDAYGVRILLEEARAMEGLGGELRLVVPGIGSVARLFELLEVGRMLNLHHDLDLEPSTDGNSGERASQSRGRRWVG